MNGHDPYRRYVVTCFGSRDESTSNISSSLCLYLLIIYEDITTNTPHDGVGSVCAVKGRDVYMYRRVGRVDLSTRWSEYGEGLRRGCVVPQGDTGVVGNPY